MRELTILVDMDDTIENLLEEWVRVLNKTHKRSVSLDDIKSWDIKEAFPGLSDEEAYAPLYEDSLWENVTPKMDAVIYLYKLFKEGHFIYITTSSNYKTLAAKMDKLLFKWFPFIDWSHVIVATKKQMINGDVMVDDGPHNLVGGNYVKILMTAPHNREYDAVSNGMRRVSNWAEVYEIIKRISEMD